MFHDVIGRLPASATGFQGTGPDRYKIHIDLLEAASVYVKQQRMRTAVTVAEAMEHQSLVWTFDDGGASMIDAAEVLERNGQRGWFFVTTNLIGMPGFLDRDGVHDLHVRGHVIGSHSVSHPDPMRSLDGDQLRKEWLESRDRLSDLCNAPIVAAAVPGGASSTGVERSAFASGYQLLFDSHVSFSLRRRNGGSILGRIAIQSHWTVSRLRRIVDRHSATCMALAMRQRVLDGARRVLGPLYLPIRHSLSRNCPDRSLGTRSQVDGE
jgi:peptidoglycan/xylan/chitin deacetylase (PgdA/CDA1 family)